MEIGLILSAALIGFSFSNTFMCAAIALSTTLGRGIKASAGFFIGRIIGIILIGSFLALFGFYFEIDTQLMLYIFGGLTLVFGVLILVFPGISSKLRILKNCEAGVCDDCEKDHGPHADDDPAHDCNGCPSSGHCPSASSEMNDIGKRKGQHFSRSGISSKFESLGVFGIFLLGLIRGATPCLKLILLLPLIISLPYLESLAITSTYALSSSLWPIMGIAGAMIIGNFSPQKVSKYLAKAGALSMIIIGIYFLYKAYNYTCQTGN